MQKARFLTAFWALAKPYWVSEQRNKGLLLAVAVIGLSLGMVYLSVQFNTWNKDFYNALEKKDQPEFLQQLWRFTYLAVFWIIAGVYRLYLQQMLLIECTGPPGCRGGWQLRRQRLAGQADLRSQLLGIAQPAARLSAGDP